MPDILKLKFFSKKRDRSLAKPTFSHCSRLDLTVTATDADDDTLTLSATGTGGFGLPDFASFEDNGDGTASLSFNPGDGDRGNYPIYVTAIDSGNVFTEYSFIVSVEAFNEAPQIEYIGDRIAVIGEPLDVLVRVEDLDEDDLTFTRDLSTRWCYFKRN